MRLITLVALFAGCASPFAAMKERDAAVAKMNADVAASNARAMENLQTAMYVVSDVAWFCGTTDDARRNTECAGGHRFDRGEKVMVIGQGAKDGVWRSERWDAQGAHAGFLLASALNELPDRGGLEEFATAVELRYPANKRIPLKSVNYAGLVGSPKAYAGRVLLFRQPSNQVLDQDFQGERFTFTIAIPSGKVNAPPARAQFELEDRELVASFRAGKRTYSCGPTYCDELVVVARLAGRTVDRADASGNVVRLPVFTVVEMADRFGSYPGGSKASR